MTRYNETVPAMRAKTAPIIRASLWKVMPPSHRSSSLTVDREIGQSAKVTDERESLDEVAHVLVAFSWVESHTGQPIFFCVNDSVWKRKKRSRLRMFSGSALFSSTGRPARLRTTARLIAKL